MKYAKVKIVGLNEIYADENMKKESDRHPDFKGDGVAIWINEKKAA